MTMPDRLSNYAGLVHRASVQSERLDALVRRLGGGFETHEPQPRAVPEQQPIVDEFNDHNAAMTLTLDRIEVALARLDALLNQDMALTKLSIAERGPHSNSRY